MQDSRQNDLERYKIQQIENMKLCLGKLLLPKKRLNDKNRGNTKKYIHLTRMNICNINVLNADSITISKIKVKVSGEVS